MTAGISITSAYEDWAWILPILERGWLRSSSTGTASQDRVVMIVGTSARFDSIIQYLGRAQGNLSKLEAQITTGKVAESFADQPQAVSLVSLKTIAASREQYLSNISAAQTRLSVTTTALDSMSDIVGKMQQLLNTNSTDSKDSRKSVATGYLQQVISLLNTQSGDTYVFGGSDTDSPPVQFPSDATDDTVWGQGGYFNYPPATGEEGKYSADAPYDGTDGYRALYYQGGPGVADDGSVSAGLKVRADRDITVPVGFSAAEPAFEALLRGIHIVASLPSDVPSGSFTQDDYDSAMAAARQLIDTAKSGLQDIEVRANSAQVMLNNAAEGHKDMLNIEQTLVSKIEDADPAEAMVKYQKVSVQLQAMYELSARIQNLSLVNYLQ